MAGFYADVPDHRIAYDRNGAIPFHSHAVTPGIVVAYSAAHCRILNDEASSSSDQNIHAGGYMGVIFPVTFTLSAYWMLLSVNNFDVDVQTFATSSDTTNGLDGTWTSLPTAVYDDGGPLNTHMSVKPEFRTHIESITPVACKAIRLSVIGNPHSAATPAGWRMHKFHLYGVPSGPTDRLAIWDPVSDALVGPAYFDWGDCAAPSADTRDFRIKNLSPSKTAQAVGVGMEALTEGSPPLVGMQAFSDDGGATYGPSLALGDLAPGEISDVLTIRRQTPVGAPAHLWAQRIVASSSVFV